MTLDGWHAALDAYEARLAAQRAALEAGDPDIGPFTPIEGLGSLPIELFGRAGELLAEAQLLERDLAARVAAAEAASAAPRSATPAFLDTRV